MFSWRTDRPGLTWAMTDRHGGVSPAPYGGLNLGSRVGDDPAAVAANRASVAAALGLAPERMVFLQQVHGADVVEVDAPGEVDPIADVVVSAATELALCVLAADCVPVLAADVAAGWVGAAHVGRPGMLAGAAPALIRALRERGATRIEAVVGPAVCGACYEVPAAMFHDAVARVPESAAVSATGTPALDIAAGVRAQLRRAGVEPQYAGACTRESARHYSYRRDGRTGRHSGIVVRRSAAPTTRTDAAAGS